MKDEHILGDHPESCKHSKRIRWHDPKRAPGNKTFHAFSKAFEKALRKIIILLRIKSNNPSKGEGGEGDERGEGGERRRRKKNEESKKEGRSQEKRKRKKKTKPRRAGPPLIHPNSRSPAPGGCMLILISGSCSATVILGMRA